MCPKWRLVFYLPASLLAVLFHPSCSSGPRAPEKGTPAFYWQAAQERFAAGDYRKTNDHLDQLLKTDNEYTSRAQAWRLVLLTGMTASHMELADSFENGARANKANPVPFRRYSSDFRNEANRLALQKAETFLDFQKKNKDTEIWLDYGFPTGSAAPVMQLTKASTGILMATEEVETAQRRVVERGVLMATCSAVGAPGDSAKALEVFKSGQVKVPRAQFMMALADSLYREAELYAPRKLDQPDRANAFCNLAMDALKEVPESKESKELKSKIGDTLKKSRKT